MKPIALYLRVSTTDQNVESQREDLTKWAKANDFNIVGVFGETISGYDVNAERLAYEEMKKYVIQNNVKDIAVWEISRLSRSMTQTVLELDFYTKHKINVHFKKEGLQSLSDNVTNKLLLTILGATAQMERDTFIERGNRGRMSAVLRGRMIGYSTPPYGYIGDDNGIITIEPNEAKVIKLIFDMASKGTSLYGIAQHLNSLKIPTRRTLQGKKRKIKGDKEFDFIWKPAPISRMLKKPLYKGVRVYKGINISIPAIVSEELWNKAQKRFEDNIGYLNKTKYEYLFKSKMQCGKCGRAIVTYKSKAVDYSYYLCTGIIDDIVKCKNGRYINSKMIDDNLYKVLFDHNNIKEIVHREVSPITEKENKKSQIDYYYKEIEALEMKQKRLNTQNIDGYLDYDDFKKEYASIKNEIINNQNKISVLQSELVALSQIDINKILKKYKDEKDFNVKRDFVSKYVNKIILNRIDIANVNWTHPLHKNEKIIYAEIFALNYQIPIKVLLTPYSKNVMVSKDFQYLSDFNMIVDISLKKS